MLKKIIIILILFTGVLLFPAEKKQDNILVIKHVSLIDGISDAINPDSTLIIKNGIIDQIVKDKEAKVPEGAFVMNLEGHYVIPGLIDAHVHVSHGHMVEIKELLSRLLLGGITMIRDMSGDARRLATLKRDAMIHEIDSPDIYYCATFGGPSFFKDPRVIESTVGDKSGLTPWARAITPETDMVKAIAEARGCGATGIKIYANLAVKEIEAIVKEAKNQNMETWSHATVFPAGPIDVIKAGVEVVSHTPLLAWEKAETIAPTYENRYDTKFDLKALKAGAFDELFKEMVEHNTILDATVFIFNMKNLGSAGADKDPETLAQFCIQATQRAHDLGVKIAVGTDFSYQPGKDFPNLLEEMALLVEKCSFTPMEVIKAATMINAETMGLETITGSIEKGKRADLVILAQNPVKKLSNIRSIRYVIKNGKIYIRQ